jgi:hypothetical protein
MSETEEGAVKWGEPNVYVGMILEPTGEGEAVADVLSSNPDVEIIRHGAYIELRAQHRLSVNYAEVSEELGGEPVDGYWMQLQMSKHYGNLIMNDDEFLLVADPRDMAGEIDQRA